MLTTVRAMKTKSSMRYRAPTPTIPHSVHLPHVATFEILKITLYGNLLPSPVEEVPDHSRASSITCVSKVIENLREKHQYLPLRINVFFRSEGRAAQFRLCTFYTSVNLKLCYNKRHHGKSSMDGIGGSLKNSVYRDVIPGKCVIDTPKQFAEYAERSVKGITSLHLLKEPEDIESSPRITDTLQIHMVKIFFDKRKVCFLEFYHLATYNEPFFTQFYGQGGCGYQNNVHGENPCGLCVKDYLPNEELLQFSICKVYFDRQNF